jgi:hypothetical protein
MKHAWDGPSSCMRTRRTLGHLLPVMRTSEGRPHWCWAKGVARFGEADGGVELARSAANPRAKALQVLGEA